MEKSDIEKLYGLSATAKLQGMVWVEWKIRSYGTSRSVPNLSLLCARSAYVDRKPTTLLQNTSKRAWRVQLLTNDIDNADDIELNFPYSPNNLHLMILNDHFTLFPKNTHADMAGATSCMIHEVLTTDVLQRSRHLLFDNNINLTKPQKELLLWHNRLSHAGLGWIQDLMYVKKGDHGDTSVPAIIPTTHSVTKRCDLEGSNVLVVYLPSNQNEQLELIRCATIPRDRWPFDAKQCTQAKKFLEINTSAELQVDLPTLLARRMPQCNTMAGLSSLITTLVSFL